MKRIALPWLLLFLALVAAVPSLAQLPKTETLLKNLETKSQFYGTVLVRRSGETVFQGAYGYSDSNLTTRTAPGLVYYIAECGELLCGTLTMMAVDKGLLALDAPIGTYVPVFKDKPGPRVRDLLSHASGFAGRYLHKGDKPRTKADTAAWAVEDGLAFPPGSRSAWERADFDVLGHTLELVTGKPYQQLLAEWILAPLGMKQTGLELFPEGKGDLAQVPRQGEWNYWMTKFADGSPAWDAYANAGDLAVFLEALAAGRLVTKDSFNRMRSGVLPESRWTIGKGKVGLGLNLTPSGAIFSQGRLGATEDEKTGYHALVLYDPRYDLTIILLANKWRPVPDDQALEVIVPVVYADLGLAE